jgi:hypothetical protein
MLGFGSLAGTPWMLWGCYLGALGLLPGCSASTSWMLWGCYLGALQVPPGCSGAATWVLCRDKIHRLPADGGDDALKRRCSRVSHGVMQCSLHLLPARCSALAEGGQHSCRQATATGQHRSSIPATCSGPTAQPTTFLVAALHGWKGGALGQQVTQQMLLLSSQLMNKM